MPKVTFTDPSGQDHVVDALADESVMLAATKNGVPGIIGECGGNASCATCHVWVREEFQTLVGPANDLEDDLLDLGVEDRRGGSRLCCQINLTDELDGLAVDVPPEHF
jgi:2Fe-2S ferredoxin